MSWAKGNPRTIQSGAASRAGRIGKGNPYLKPSSARAPPSAAPAPSSANATANPQAPRQARNPRATARTILVTIWHLHTSRTARFRGLGPGHYASRTDKDKKARGHIRSSKPSDTPSPSPRPHDLRLRTIVPRDHQPGPLPLPG